MSVGRTLVTDDVTPTRRAATLSAASSVGVTPGSRAMASHAQVSQRSRVAGDVGHFAIAMLKVGPNVK